MSRSGKAVDVETLPPAPPPEIPEITPPGDLGVPEYRPTLGDRFTGGRRIVAIGAVVAALLVAVLYFTTRPRIIDQPHPVEADPASVLPLPLDPGAPITTAFALLGSQVPEPHPDDARLTRYAFGTDLQVDALNQIVYAITFSVPNRSWQGLRVGIPEQSARGGLALLGTPREVTQGSPADPEFVRGLAVFPSLDERPVRTLRAQVRPPNGCIDVLVDLQPRAIGVLLHDDQRWAVIGDGADVSLEWVVTRVRVVSRSIRGPYAAGVDC